MRIPPELVSSCADVVPASAADTVAGCRARYVAAPASTEEASALLRAAARLGLTVVARGAGRLQHWGNPPDSCDLIVDTHRLNRIVEHSRADFTVAVQAGVRLNELAEALAPAHQALAVLPPHRAWAGTVGGLIATNAAGPTRYRYGTPRDLLAAITAVRADGTIIRSGEATDNGAGHDLVALFAGSYGTLGLITEATFRLHPTTQASGGVWVPCTSPEHAARMVELVSDPWTAPWGIDLRWPAGKPIGLVVSIKGDREFLAPDHGGLSPAVAQALLARRDQVRTELLYPSPDTGTLIQVTFPPGLLARVLTATQAAAAGSVLAVTIEGSAGAGVLDVRVPAESPAASVTGFVAAVRAELRSLADPGTAPGTAGAVLVYAPDEVRDLTDTFGPVPSLALMRAIKDEFDPEHRMAPGRFAASM